MSATESLAQSASGPTRPGVESSAIRSVTTYLSPYDYWHDRYQAYYCEGLRRFLKGIGGELHEVNLRRFPRMLAAMRRVRNSSRVGKALGGRMLHRAADWLAERAGGSRLPPSGRFHPLVGQYLFQTRDGLVCKVCVDAQDSGEVGSPELVEWSDLYFKTNYWESKNYSRKIVPLVNGNPLVLGKEDQLRAMRQASPRYDLCFLVRVWGGVDEEEGIEHNLRLLEAVARAPGKKFLLAYLVAGDIPTYARRLERQGIPWSCRPMPLQELWEVAAQSRLNLIRLGMHACVPWRMMDLLAMGACPVLDQTPYTVWPEPLREGVHFLSLDAATRSGRLVASEEAYAAIPERLGEFLADPRMVEQVRANNRDYFDRFAAPEAVGRYCCERVLARNATA